MKNKITRTLGLVAAATGIILGGTVTSVAPAQAAVSSCTFNYAGGAAGGTCYGTGGSTFKLQLTCYAAWPWESTWTKTSSSYTIPKGVGALSFYWKPGCNDVTNNWVLKVIR